MEDNNVSVENEANLTSQFSYEDYLKSLPENVRKDLEIGSQTEAKGINAALTVGPLAAKPVLLKAIFGGAASLIKKYPLKALDTVMTGVGASDIINNPQDIAFETMSQKFDAMGGLKTKGYIKTGQFVYDQLSSIFKGNTLKQLAPVVPSVNQSNLNVLKTVKPVIQPSGGSTILQSVDNLDGVFTKGSVTEQALSYKRKAFNVSNKSIPDIKNQFIKDLTEVSGLDTATVTKKYDEILTSGRIKKPRNFAGTPDQYKQVKAYFQSIQDLGIEKKKSLYAVIDTADGPKKYFPDFKGGKANRAAVISLDAKLARVKITNKKRWQRILNQTLNKEDIGNWHTKMAKKLGDEAHHLNELHLIGVMTDGRSIDSQLSVIKQLNDELIFTGNSTFNKFNLPVKVHDRVHNEMRRVFAEYKNIDFTKMSNDQLVNFFKTDYKPKIQEIQEIIFSEMQLHKKTK